jgi:putative peptide zinc metalloprotease protein
MMRLRPDLLIEQRKSDGVSVYTVRDPISGDDFEFGAEEYFLIERVGAGEPPDRVALAFREHFGASIERRQIDAFVDRLRLWKLISDEPVETADGSSHAWVAEADAEDLNLEGHWDDHGDRSPSANANARWQPDRAGVLPRPLRYKALWHKPRWIGGIAWLLRPLRFLLYLIPVAMVVAIPTLVHQWPLVAADLERLWRPWNVFEHLLFSLLTVNLLSKITSGATCSAAGGFVSSFGIHLALGFIPRFHVELGGWDNMERRGMLWTLASPLVAKLVVFSLGVLLWYLSRDGGTQLPMIGFVLATVAFLSLLVSGNPFGVGDGYALMSGLLQQSNLRGKAFRALFGRLLPKRRRLQVDPSSVGALRLYGLATIAYVLLLLGLIVHFAAVWLESRFEGTGVLIFLLLLLALFTQVFRRVSARKRRFAMSAPSPTDAAAAGRLRGADAADAGRLRGRPRAADRQGRTGQKRGVRWGWILLLLALGASFFIPYEYETGGRLELKAWDRREIYSESPGIVEKVEVDGGRWVEAGTVVAAMSSYRESAEVDSLRAQIQRQEAVLQELLTTPRKEEVELAAKKYEAARVREKFAEAEANRMERLRKDGNVSETEYDEAMRRREVAIQETLELKANLDLVSEGPHPQEIEAARAELKRLQAELARQEERLLRTRLVSPISGRLEQLNLADLTGKYLDDGDLYTAIIDDRVLRAEIEVPESDLPLVAIGDRARLKLWAYPDRILVGEVVDIEPAVERKDFGHVSRVHVRVPNEDGVYRAGMTGYGKLSGQLESVALAFTHRLVRFFSVEVWSWIP